MCRPSLRMRSYRASFGTADTGAMNDGQEIVLRLPPELALFLERTVHDVWEHIAGGREIVPGPPELERELASADVGRARGSRSVAPIRRGAA